MVVAGRNGWPFRRTVKLFWNGVVEFDCLTVIPIDPEFHSSRVRPRTLKMKEICSAGAKMPLGSAWSLKPPA